jgi:aminoglycoside phosphotransferase (APT) family kinase protein
MEVMEITQETVEIALRSHLGTDESLSLEPTSTGRFNASWFVQYGHRDLVLRVAPSDDAPSCSTNGR